MPVFMKYGKINGEVTGKYKGWIELNSVQFGAARSMAKPTGRGSEREATAPSISEIVVTKGHDSTSTALFQDALNGTGVPVTIDFVQPGDPLLTVYLRIELENALISGYSMSGAGDKPLESMTLNFTKITYTNTVATPPPANTGPGFTLRRP